MLSLFVFCKYVVFQYANVIIFFGFSIQLFKIFGKISKKTDKRRFDLAQNEQRYRNDGQTLLLTDFSVLTNIIILNHESGKSNEWMKMKIEMP